MVNPLSEEASKHTTAIVDHKKEVYDEMVSLYREEYYNSDEGKEVSNALKYLDEAFVRVSEEKKKLNRISKILEHSMRKISSSVSHMSHNAVTAIIEEKKDEVTRGAEDHLEALRTLRQLVSGSSNEGR